MTRCNVCHCKIDKVGGYVPKDQDHYYHFGNGGIQIILPKDRSFTVDDAMPRMHLELENPNMVRSLWLEKEMAVPYEKI